MELLAPRFSGLGYIFGVFHDYRSIENLEDKVKEKARMRVNGGVRKGKDVLTEREYTTKEWANPLA